MKAVSSSRGRTKTSSTAAAPTPRCGGGRRALRSRRPIREGEEGRRFYIVVRGKVSVNAKGSDGRARRLATLEDGDLFGEIALLTNSPTTATVETLTPSIFLALQREQLDHLMRRHQGLAEQVRGALESHRAGTCDTCT